MKIAFECPSCAVSGSVDDRHVGRRVRCKQCGTQFEIRDPNTDEPDVYAIDEPEAAPHAEIGPAPFDDGSVFVTKRSHEEAPPYRPMTTAEPPRAQSRSRKKGRRAEREIPWGKLLTWGSVGLAATLGGIAFFAPDGVWLAGCILMALGMLLLLGGFFTGAYAAFTEDFIYGMLFLLIPLYTAYYLVTNWDDLWICVAISTVGVVLAMMGVTIVEWSMPPA